jgi:hypothetical protein
MIFASFCDSTKYWSSAATLLAPFGIFVNCLMMRSGLLSCPRKSFHSSIESDSNVFWHFAIAFKLAATTALAEGTKNSRAASTLSEKSSWE